MDFVSDTLFDGRRLRALTVVDAYTREALAIDVDQGIKGEQVVAAMGGIALWRVAPRTIRVDYGPEVRIRLTAPADGLRSDIAA